MDGALTATLRTLVVLFLFCGPAGVLAGCGQRGNSKRGEGGSDSSSGGQVAAGGSSTSGGNTATGGSHGGGGTVGVTSGGTPGRDAGGGSGGAGAGGRGGGETTGSATAGTTGSGGIGRDDGGSGGEIDAGDADRCNVGIYDPAAPPRVLSLTGSLATHDPSVIAAGGTYYLFFTGLGAETSTTLTAWRAAAKPFAAPSWLKSSVPGVSDLWAPDVSQFGGRFHLYYAGSTFGSNRSCIGHATRDSMIAGAWLDDDAATICTNVTTSDDWNAIDPNVIADTGGKYWLTLGSFWSGIKIVELDSAGKRVGNTVTSIAARPSKSGALEAPFMIRRCGYYYLFVSWDACCKGADSTYNIRVVRGSSVTGPFVDKADVAALQGGGTLIAQGDASFAGPGGQSVLFAGNKAYLVYHAYAKSDGAITLRIAELVWDSNGWPIPVGP